ncbi:hypothetical protein HF086_009081 [Spodoptera exigua]|uniref:Kazal-like domain-containing protein n=1 Tax=Spodoptera exigua TaxID=7107 RepID=A0A922M662_SPOEX|nr:hypothetical protein HF086_009081 [Spodoptera exigua]
MLREKNPQEEYANRFSIPVQTEKNTGRTPPFRDTLPDECDYLAKYCSRTYLTSEVCGRSLQYQYQSFKNYCLLDFVNCREVWQLLHMGKCYTYKDITDYKHFQYEDDAFLSKDYVIDKHQWKLKDMPRYVQEKYNWE